MRIERKDPAERRCEFVCVFTGDRETLEWYRLDCIFRNCWGYLSVGPLGARFN